MLEAYLFAAGEGSSPEQALQAALSRVGGRLQWIEELVWLGGLAPALSQPALSLPDQPGLDHFVLNALLRQLLSGERQFLALGQTCAGSSLALLLGGPAAVGRRNLLPRARLQPAPALPADPAALADALEAFVLSLAETPPLPEPSEEDKPLIISPAKPPPLPIPPLKIPVVSLLALRGVERPVLPAARRLDRAPGALFAMAELARALETGREEWGGLCSTLETASLLTLLERL